MQLFSILVGTSFGEECYNCATYDLTKVDWKGKQEYLEGLMGQTMSSVRIDKKCFNENELSGFKKTCSGSCYVRMILYFQLIRSNYYADSII